MGTEPRTYIIDKNDCDYTYENGEKFAKCRVTDELTGEEAPEEATERINQQTWHGLPDHAWVYAPRDDW